MKTLRAVLAVFILAATTGFAGGPPKVTDLAAALEQAKSENKMLFVQYGREACSNCQALKGYIKSRGVNLSNDKFVYADVNCDDAKTSLLFSKQFKVSGNMLPFVVVASAEGRQLAARSGYGTARDYQELLRAASKVAKAKD